MVYPSCSSVANAKDADRPGMMQFGKSAVLTSITRGADSETKIIFTYEHY